MQIRALRRKIQASCGLTAQRRLDLAESGWILLSCNAALALVGVSKEAVALDPLPALIDALLTWPPPGGPPVRALGVASGPNMGVRTGGVGPAWGAVAVSGSDSTPPPELEREGPAVEAGRLGTRLVHKL